MVRLSYASAAILQAVAGGSRYGFDVMEATGLPSGTVYPALHRLEANGLVYSDWEDNAVARRAGRPRRRYYEISSSGKAVLEAARRRFPILSQPQLATDS